MSCKGVQSDLSAYLDSELSDSRLEEVRSHLITCEDCNDLFQLLESTRLAVRAAVPDRVTGSYTQGIGVTSHRPYSQPAFSQRSLVLPLAIATTMTLVLILIGRVEKPIDLADPMTNLDAFELKLPGDSPDPSFSLPRQIMGPFLRDSPGFDVQAPGMDLDDSIPGMGDYSSSRRESS